MSNYNDNRNANGGIGFLGILFIVFLVLKLTGFITWSWWWVTIPLWGPFVLWFVIIFVFLGIIKLFNR